MISRRKRSSNLLRRYRRSLAAGSAVCCSSSTTTSTMAHKVVGVGSVGTRCWIVLLLGRDDRDALVLAGEGVVGFRARAAPCAGPLRESTAPARRRGANASMQAGRATSSWVGSATPPGSTANETRLLCANSSGTGRGAFDVDTRLGVRTRGRTRTSAAGRLRAHTRGPATASRSLRTSAKGDVFDRRRSPSSPPAYAEVAEGGPPRVSPTTPGDRPVQGDARAPGST